VLPTGQNKDAKVHFSGANHLSPSHLLYANRRTWETINNLRCRVTLNWDHQSLTTSDAIEPLRNSGELFGPCPEDVPKSVLQKINPQVFKDNFIHLKRRPETQ